ncbi:MAG: hypothetical protein GF311_21525 [Candidatus Lokiarchaeota archaeon]|nr:hypothetical protein [Candidatus Lokiarchaeota archaeon]
MVDLTFHQEIEVVKKLADAIKNNRISNENLIVAVKKITNDVEIDELPNLIDLIPEREFKKELTNFFVNIYISHRNDHERLSALQIISYKDIDKFKSLYSHILENEQNDSIILFAVERMRQINDVKKCIMNFRYVRDMSNADRRLQSHYYMERFSSSEYRKTNIILNKEKIIKNLNKK